MALYTTQVRTICESYAGLEESAGYNQINDIIAEARDKIFEEYPIFDEEYRSVLNTKILRHYYTREIGMETVGLWKHFLNTRLNEIMPYYNKLYQSELLSFNPLYDVDYTKTGTKEGEETGEENGTNTGSTSDATTGTIGDSGTRNNTRTDNLTSNSRDGGTDSDSGSNVNKNDRWEYYNDTPQGSIQDLEDLTYLTSARHITDDGTGSTNSKTTTYGKTNTTTNTGTVGNSETNANTRTYNTSVDGTSSERTTKNKSIESLVEYSEHVVGKMAGKSYTEMLLDFRKTFLNIDMMIIKELGDLFMGLWD